MNHNYLLLLMLMIKMLIHSLINAMTMINTAFVGLENGQMVPFKAVSMFLFDAPDHNAG